MRASGLAEQRQGVTVLGDGAYLNTGLVVRTADRQRMAFDVEVALDLKTFGAVENDPCPR
ncbi:hypothetical protein GCM10010341_76150 [Streptomyces noursei]|nr:hypothetical protein GCM10010341_76150 [Streptomyces noursei]